MGCSHTVRAGKLVEALNRVAVDLLLGFVAHGQDDRRASSNTAMPCSRRQQRLSLSSPLCLFFTGRLLQALLSRLFSTGASVRFCRRIRRHHASIISSIVGRRHRRQGEARRSVV
jgi:hypothetical protein